ncbi:MAG: Tim44 domain-containing protein [Desulfovibrio sp.]|nr:Tim44 domain-containing protein [Desulfovibrio sp.]
MKHCLAFCIVFLALSTLGLTCIDDSWAARMGGGRSFGSQPTMRTPTVAPRPMQSPRQQPYTNPSAAAPARTGGMGAMGGLFGGLLAGTVLGSLLGGGSAAGAAGGGIGFIDVILFGLLIWFGLKFFRRMRGAQQEPSPQPGYQQGYQRDYSMRQDNGYQQGSNAWDRLRDSVNPGQGVSGFGAPSVPADFDVEEFLQGAKSAYVRMQSSWDQRDLEDIAQFATPAVMEVLREQMAEDPNPSHTELINISVQLMGVHTEGRTQRAQVYFDVLLREDPSQQRPEPAREVWHFLRTLPDGTWKLDGIQQAN